jgi:hypothetical protein
VAEFDRLDHAGDDLAGAVLEFLELTLALGITDLLEDHLLGRLRVDAADTIASLSLAGTLSGAATLSTGTLTANGAAANIRSGRLKALAVTTAQRSSAMPDVPTVAEAGRDRS